MVMGNPKRARSIRAPVNRTGRPVGTALRHSSIRKSAEDQQADPRRERQVVVQTQAIGHASFPR